MNASLATALAAIVIALTLAMLNLASESPQPGAGLPPCPTEDSTGCYWDADTRGNGIGHDVIDLGTDGAVVVNP